MFTFKLLQLLKRKNSASAHIRIVFFSSSITKLLTVTCQSFQLTAFLFIGWKYTKKQMQTHTQLNSTQTMFVKQKKNIKIQPLTLFI